MLHLIHFPFRPRREVIVGDKGQDRDQQAGGGCNQRFGDAAGDGVGLADADVGHDFERADHADHRAEQAE